MLWGKSKCEDEPVMRLPFPYVVQCVTDFNVSIFPGPLLQTGTAKTKLAVLLDLALKYICRINNFVVADLHLVLRVSAFLYGSLVEKTIYTTLLN